MTIPAAPLLTPPRVLVPLPRAAQVATHPIVAPALVQPHAQASVAFAHHLATGWRAGGRASVTWLNHHTAQLVADEPELMDAFDYVAVDGMLLSKLVDHTVPRTSADMVIAPLLGALPGARVALVGGVPSKVLARRRVLQDMLAPQAKLVANVDGFEGCPTDVEQWVADVRPDVVIVGMGGFAQDRVACRIAASLDRGLVLTCGGFLDQILNPTYYPSWAYPLRLNWAVRLGREPGRLWRRYTIEAAEAVLSQNRLRRQLLATPGYRRLSELLRSE